IDLVEHDDAAAAAMRSAEQSDGIQERLDILAGGQLVAGRGGPGTVQQTIVRSEAGEGSKEAGGLGRNAEAAQIRTAERAQSLVRGCAVIARKACHCRADQEKRKDHKRQQETCTGAVSQLTFAQRRVE